MSPYRFQYNESESDIKKYNSLYKNTKKAKTLSKKNETFGKFQKSQNFKNPNFYLAFSTRSIIHIFYIFSKQKTENFKIVFSKTQSFILYSAYVPQFIFLYFLYLYIFISTYLYISIYLYN